MALSGKSGLVTLLFLTMTSLLYSQNIDTSRVYCSTVNGLRVRSMPSLDVSSQTIATLREGETVHFLGVRSTHSAIVTLRSQTYTNVFMFIRTMGGQEGWVFADALCPGTVSGVTDWQSDRLQGPVSKRIIKQKYPDGSVNLKSIDRYDLLGRKYYYAYYWSGPEPAYEVWISYDKAGRKKNASNLKVTYDKKGYLVYLEEKVPVEGSETGESDLLSYTYRYDSSGRILEEDNTGMMTWINISYKYQKSGRLSERIWNCASDVAGEELETTLYYYNAQGRLDYAEQTYTSSMDEKALKSYIKYDLDKQGNIIRSVKYGEHKEIQSELLYTYEYWQ